MFYTVLNQKGLLSVKLPISLLRILSRFHDVGLVARSLPRTHLRLRPVDDNSYDPQAVEVWRDVELSIRVGFVERKDAPRVRSLPPKPAGWRLRVTDRSDRVLIAALERITTERSDALAEQLTGGGHASHDPPQDLLSGSSGESQGSPARRRGTTQR